MRLFRLHDQEIIVDFYFQLQVFLWAIEAGNFSSVARDHDLSPSSVSKAISALEKKLGVKLFHRGPNVHRLTEEGLAYKASAQAVIEAVSAAEKLAETLPQRVAGVLKIHAMATFAKHQILAWLPEFLERYPELRVEVEVGAQYVDVFNRGVDIAIHSGVLPDSNHVAHRIGQTDWLVCASPAYIELHGEPEKPEDLLAHRCFNFSFPSPWNSWSFQQDGEVIVVPVKCQASFTQGDLLRDLALAGAGIVRLASFHVGADISSGALVPLLKRHHVSMPEPVYLVHAHRSDQSPRVSAFTSFLVERIDASAWSNQFNQAAP